MAKKKSKGSKSRKKSRPEIVVTRLPRKQRKAVEASRPSRKPSIHKIRSRWFQSRASWPFREADIAKLSAERARAATALASHPAATGWSLIGPTNIGGRMTSLVCDPADPDHVWAGAAGGGVWESVDAGNSWTAVWHQEESLNVGSLAIDPNDTQKIYCGTGEANLSADSYAGTGVYRSEDGGQTWTLWADARIGEVPSRIGVIAVDPFDSGHVVLGGIDSAGAPSGFYSRNTAAPGWEKQTVIQGGAHYWCHAIVFDPVNQGVLYTAVTEQGAGSGIYKSTDGGASWNQLKTGLPVGFLVHRASLAISPSNPDVLYAQIADARNRGDSVLGVFRTDNGGSSWKEVGGGHFREERQMSYNNTIAVHPTDPNRVICGGVDLHRSKDGGQTWHVVTHWFEDPGNPHYAHADHHALLFPPADPERVYSANDGGVDVSHDRGRSWFNRSLGLSTTMYYDMDVSQADGRLFGGGAQDNGTPITVTGSADDHFDITGGDGGWIVFDPGDPNHVIASIYYMNIFRFRGSWVDITPRGATEQEEAILAAERRSVWMVFLAMDPNDGNTLFTGTQRVWRTRDDGNNWDPVSPVLDGSDISALAIARSDSQVVYAGTENGAFYRSTDGGDTWKGNLAGGTLPGVTVTRITVKPDNAAVVLVTVANSGHSHVFRSNDGGDTWEDVDQGALPDAPFHSITIPSTKPRTVFACGDAGVYVSSNLGATWRNLTGNLPNTMMVDLVYHDQDDTLSVATYGRSLWRLKL